MGQSKRTIEQTSGFSEKCESAMNVTIIENVIKVDWASFWKNNKLEFWGVILFFFASALATAIRICRKSRNGGKYPGRAPML